MVSRTLGLSAWAPWAAGGAIVVGMTAGAYGLGRLQEARIGAAALVDYKSQQAARTVTIIQKQVQVVTKTEIEYRGRVQKIYLQGASIEKRIPQYIQPDDDRHFAVNVGFVRVLDGAWAGRVDGPADDSDKHPSGIPLSGIAAVEAGNITSCRAWREQALGWRVFYSRQQIAINGEAGVWYTSTLDDAQPMEASADQ